MLCLGARYVCNAMCIDACVAVCCGALCVAVCVVVCVLTAVCVLRCVQRYMLLRVSLCVAVGVVYERWGLTHTTFLPYLSTPLLLLHLLHPLPSPSPSPSPSSSPPHQVQWSFTDSACASAIAADGNAASGRYVLLRLCIAACVLLRVCCCVCCRGSLWVCRGALYASGEAGLTHTHHSSSPSSPRPLPVLSCTSPLMATPPRAVLTWRRGR